MSGSLVDAIDKRRRGPDLSSIPDSLKPLLEAMLRPNPQDRLRSMDAVVAMLDGTGVPIAPPPPPEHVEITPAGQGGSKAPLLIALVALALLIVAGVYLFRDRIPLLGGGGGHP